jgi:hypothetical protein
MSPLLGNLGTDVKVAVGVVGISVAAYALYKLEIITFLLFY